MYLIMDGYVYKIIKLKFTLFKILTNTYFNMNFIFGIITFLVSIISFIVWMISLTSGADTVAIYFWIGVFSLILLALTINGVIDIKSKNEMEIREMNVAYQQEKTLKLKEEEALKLIQLDIQKQSYIDSYGDLSKEISFKKSTSYPYNIDYNNTILIFENSSKIIIQNKILSFKDIIAFELKDDEQIIYHGSSSTSKSSTSTSKSSTSTGSMIGRAVVGGVLLGGVGALIGGATAKKDITTINTPQQAIVSHNFKVNIIVNSISNPQIILNLEKNNTAANELVAVMSVILERNKIM